MQVLAACEESQEVCKAFRKLGHEAYSCDLQPCSGGHPEWHFQEDVFEVIDSREWDMILAFPPCTHLSSAGSRYWKEKIADGRQQEALEFVLRLYNSGDRVAIENPVGRLSTAWRKPDQIINPFQFGHPFTKKTCLWLKGLPLLASTELVEPTHRWTSNSTRGGPRKDGTRKESELPSRKAWTTAKDRSKTFPGIAKAMAEQWGVL